jgi:hypothetical protein
MIYCPECGRNNPDDADVCAYCSAQIHPGRYPNWDNPLQKEDVTPEKRADRSRNADKAVKKVVIALFIGVFVLGMAWLALSAIYTATDDNNADNGGIDNGNGGDSSAIQADFTYTPRNPTTNDLINFTDTSTSKKGNITSYYWEFVYAIDERAVTSIYANPLYRYEFGYGQSFPVRLTVTDNHGNTDSITKYISIGHQTDIPGNSDISVEVLNHERKNHDIDGWTGPSENWTFVWLDIKVTNNWDRDIFPSWGYTNYTTVDLEPLWEEHFYLYTKHEDEPEWTDPESWICSQISPHDRPLILAPGNSYTWTVTFWIAKIDIYSDKLGENIENKVEFRYYYDKNLNDRKEVNFSAPL